MRGRAVVTEGTGSFYKSRSILQMLYDFSGAQSIVAHGDSIASSKKTLISRSARYSGLLDVLDYSEGTMPEGADAWVAINADEAALPAQLSDAKAAGISRVFVLMTEDGPTPCPSDVAALEAQLKEAGMVYTVMRTGELVEDGGGGGLVLSDLDVPVCGAVSKEDVFRFVTEALTLPEASGRIFSLCPSETAATALREMRFRGYDRRDEVKALLGGAIAEEAPPAEVAAATAEMGEAETAVEQKTEAEDTADREEELKMLIERARQRGIETEAAMKAKEEETLKRREEMSKYYSSPSKDDDKDDDDAPPAVPDTPPPPPEA